jgi:hypothetical protein
MKVVFAAMGMCALVACATPYQPESFSGGFSEIPLASDTYQISVSGNGYTSKSAVREMSLLRAAELARENGFTHFVVLDSADATKTNTFVTPGSSQTNTYGSATAYSYGNSATAYGQSSSTTSFTPAQTQYVVKPGTDLVVRFVPAEFADEVRALSVEQVFAMYAEKYGLQ